MNTYKQILEQEYGKDYAKAAIKTARKIVKLSNTPMPTKKQHDEMARIYAIGFNRPGILAVVAIFAEQNKGQITINSEQLFGKLFTRKHFAELESEGLVRIYAVAQPHQFVFSA